MRTYPPADSHILSTASGSVEVVLHLADMYNVTTFFKTDRLLMTLPLEVTIPYADHEDSVEELAKFPKG